MRPRFHRVLVLAGIGCATTAPAQNMPQGSPLSPAPAVRPVPGAMQEPVLPLHSGDPMAIREADDPLLRLTSQSAPEALFRRIIVETVANAPSGAEAEAGRDEAKAALDEAKAGQRPTIDVSLSSYKVISRNFGNNPENVIEQARPNRRTDNLLNAEQLLLDAGGARARIGAATARLRGADLEVESAADRTALETIAAWYDVFTFRSLVALSSAFTQSQRELRVMVQERVKSGVSAPADVARVDSYIASADARLARFRRQAAQADARYTALIGRAPPAGLSRAPVSAIPISRDLAAMRAGDTPAVRAAQAAADAARKDAKAAKSDTYPTLSAGLDAGRYGVFETPRDYDIRARITLRQRILGGVGPRARQAAARARSVDARATRIGVEAQRDAEIAWSDVIALQDQAAALKASYLASRRSRDTIAERFRVARGTLFDIIGAEDSYFETAAGYLQAVTELDASRYVLLSRTGMLLATFGIEGVIVPKPVRPAEPAPPFTGPKP